MLLNWNVYLDKSYRWMFAMSIGNYSKSFIVDKNAVIIVKYFRVVDI